MVACQHYGPLLGPLNTRCIISRTQKRDHNFDNYPYAESVSISTSISIPSLIWTPKKGTPNFDNYPHVKVDSRYYHPLGFWALVGWDFGSLPQRVQVPHSKGIRA